MPILTLEIKRQRMLNWYNWRKEIPRARASSAGTGLISAMAAFISYGIQMRLPKEKTQATRLRNSTNR